MYSSKELLYLLLFQIFPKSIYLYIAYARFLEKQDRIEEAYNLLYAQVFEQASYGNFGLTNNLGYYALRLFKATQNQYYLDIASKAFICAAGIEPDNLILIKNQADYYLSDVEPDHKLAVECLEQIYQHEPDDDELIWQIIDSSLKLSDHQKALKYLLVFYQEFGNCESEQEIDLCFKIAMTQTVLGNYEEAVLFFCKTRELINQGPRNTSALVRCILGFSWLDSLRNKKQKSEEKYKIATRLAYNYSLGEEDAYLNFFKTIIEEMATICPEKISWEEERAHFLDKFWEIKNEVPPSKQGTEYKMEESFSDLPVNSKDHGKDSDFGKKDPDSEKF